MPTTLPIDFSALPFTARPKPSILSRIPIDLVVITIWSLALLAISVLAYHRGLPVDSFDIVFQ